MDHTYQFSLYDVVRFQKTLQQKTGREIAIITANDINNRNFADAIVREGVVVYES